MPDLTVKRTSPNQLALLDEDTLSQGVHVSLREPAYEGSECSLEDGVVDVEQKGDGEGEVVEAVLPGVGVHLCEGE